MMNWSAVNKDNLSLHFDLVHFFGKQWWNLVRIKVKEGAIDTSYM
jgi:hypothetical protein